MKELKDLAEKLNEFPIEVLSPAGYWEFSKLRVRLSADLQKKEGAAQKIVASYFPNYDGRSSIKIGLNEDLHDEISGLRFDLSEWANNFLNYYKIEVDQRTVPSFASSYHYSESAALKDREEHLKAIFKDVLGSDIDQEALNVLKTKEFSTESEWKRIAERYKSIRVSIQEFRDPPKHFLEHTLLEPSLVAILSVIPTTESGRSVALYFTVLESLMKETIGEVGVTLLTEFGILGGHKHSSLVRRGDEIVNAVKSVEWEKMFSTDEGFSYARLIVASLSAPGTIDPKQLMIAAKDIERKIDDTAIVSKGFDVDSLVDFLEFQIRKGINLNYVNVRENLASRVAKYFKFFPNEEKSNLIRAMNLADRFNVSDHQMIVSYSLMQKITNNHLFSNAEEMRLEAIELASMVKSSIEPPPQSFLTREELLAAAEVVGGNGGPHSIGVAKVKQILDKKIKEQKEAARSRTTSYSSPSQRSNHTSLIWGALLWNSANSD